MATVCDTCGVKDNEVKGGSGIEPQGTRITLRITTALDLSRDILKVRKDLDSRKRSIQSPNLTKPHSFNYPPPLIF